MQLSIKEIFDIALKKGLESELFHNVFVFNDMSELTQVYEYPFRFNAFLVLMSKKGTCKLRVNVGDIEVKDNDLLVITPDTLVTAVSISNDFNASIAVVPIEFMKELNLDFKEYLPYYFSIKGAIIIPMCNNCRSRIWKCSDIISDISPEKFDDKELRNSFVKAFISSIKFAFENHLLNQNPKEKVSNSASELVETFFLLLKENYFLQHGVKFYAKENNLTPKYFSKLIKQYTGKGASEWIDDYLIVEAQNRLRYSNSTISQISDELGFSSQTLFTKTFRRLYGCAPGEYRKK